MRNETELKEKRYLQFLGQSKHRPVLNQLGLFSSGQRGFLGGFYTLLLECIYQHKTNKNKKDKGIILNNNNNYYFYYCCYYWGEHERAPH